MSLRHVLLLLLFWGCGSATLAKQDGGAAGNDAAVTGGAGGAAAKGGAGGAAGKGGIGGLPAGGTPGTAGTSAAGGAGGGCVSETDAAFCTRLGKSCETVAGTDNCGAARSTDCGTCATGMGCVVNACQTPVCTTSSYQGSAFSAFSVSGLAEGIVSASASGQSIAYARAATSCGTTISVYLADQTAPGIYTSRDITSWITGNGLFLEVGQMAALSADGLTLIAFSADQTKIESAKRSAQQLIDFGAPSAADFVTVNGFVAGTAGKFRAPAISADGLELYYTINGISTAADGIYRSVRASAAVPFPAGARVTALTSDYEYVAAISSDRLTLFVFKGFVSYLFKRLSTSAEWSNPNAPAAPDAIGGWDHKPFADCRTLVGTASTAGGCTNQDIYFFYRQ